MDDTDAGSRRRVAGYHFGPLHRPGVVAGFRGGQLATVAAGAMVAVGLVRVWGATGAVVVAVAVVLAAVLAATWPVRGRTLEEWAPDAARFAAGRLRGIRRDGQVFRWLRVTSVEVVGALTIGVLVDRRRGVHSAVLPVSCPGFLLAAPEERDRLVADWAAVLAAACARSGAVHRVQWIERAVPDDASGHLADLERRAAVAADHPARRSYRALVEGLGNGARHHGVVLAVSVRAARGGSVHRRSTEACAALVREVAALRRRLADARIDTGDPLGPEQLAAYAASAFRRGGVVAADPLLACGHGAPRSTPWATRPTDTWWPWPMATEVHWGRLHTDGVWHVTYWVAQWPRTEVAADFLVPVLLAGDCRRTVSVVMAPVGAADAARQVERDRTAEAADRELRRRGGFVVSARWQRQTDALVRREMELADGHGLVRFSGYVAVTADDPDRLQASCDQIEQAAAAAGIELHRCYGDQLNALVATLPTGSGVP